MLHSNDYVVEVNQNNFESIVLLAPEEQTIVVDFWAPWCGPCRTLTPVLERVVHSYDGRVLLAKVNVDDNPLLSTQYGIQGIPAVKVFKEGEVVGQFVGALPESEIRRILNPLITSQADDFVEHGRLLHDQGSPGEAEIYFQKALESDPKHSGAKLELAKRAIQRGDLEQAEQLAKSIEIIDKEHDEAQGILNRIQFHRECKSTDMSELQARIQADENDLDARYDLACCLVAQGQYRNALEEFLTIVKKNKNYRDGATKQSMVKVFSIVGQRTPLADEYRDKLEWVLY